MQEKTQNSAWVFLLYPCKLCRDPSAVFLSPVGVNVEDEDHGTQNQSQGAQNQHGDLPAHPCSHEWSSVILEDFIFAQSQLRFFFIHSSF